MLFDCAEITLYPTNDKKDRALISYLWQNCKLDKFAQSYQKLLKVAHLSCSFASLSPKHSKFSSLSSENSSCLKSGDVEAPMAESASVSECGESLVLLKMEGGLLDIIPPSTAGSWDYFSIFDFPVVSFVFVWSHRTNTKPRQNGSAGLDNPLKSLETHTIVRPQLTFSIFTWPIWSYGEFVSSPCLLEITDNSNTNKMRTPSFSGLSVNGVSQQSQQRGQTTIMSRSTNKANCWIGHRASKDTIGSN